MDSPESLVQVRASAVKVGMHVMIKNQPCKVTAQTHVKPGKHGAAKCTITGKSLLTGASVEEGKPGSHVFYSFKPQRQTYQLNFWDAGALELDCLDEKNEQKTIRLASRDKVSFSQMEQWIKDDQQVIVQTFLFPKAAPWDDDDLEMVERLDDIKLAD